MSDATLFDRDLLAHPSIEVAPLLLGARLTSTIDGERVVVELTEVEAYQGADDPGSHAYRGRTARNEVMFGEAGHLYVYFTYGMHWCANIVTDRPGVASGILLRGGRVVAGLEAARRRRPAARTDRDLARGPARLASALGIDSAQLGHDVALPPVRLEVGTPLDPAVISTGPRVGVAGQGGDPVAFPWRFWITGDAGVSVYRPAAPRRRGEGRRVRQ
ncbi:DNA-3-methyladenine glycosylase [Propionibacteriaceae bacterium G1746]|uniref:DNA-3-methyladenine glycosylase n=1 Tax=Aestuariimicrobium sp. G57 TaxID=3418485 RepID=UPI003C1D513A